MRRNQHIRCIPQRIVGGQGLRVRDVEGRACNLFGFQGANEGRLVDYFAAGDVGDVGS